MSLHNLGNNLNKLDRSENVPKTIQEAVDIYRALAISRPDAFLPYLANSLTSLGHSLSESGQREEAQKATKEAVNIYRSPLASGLK